MSNITTLTTLLRTASLGEIKDSHYAYLSRDRKRVMAKMAFASKLKFDESSDKSTWGLGFETMSEDATYQTSYLQGMQSADVKPMKQLEMYLPLFQNDSERYDEAQARAHAKSNTKFTNYLQSIQTQVMDTVSSKTNKLLWMYPSSTTGLSEQVHGLLTWIQPQRNASTGAIEANSTGGLTGQLTVCADSTKTATLVGVDRSSDTYARYRNWNQSTSPETNQDTFLAIQRAMLNTNYETLPYSTSQYSVGNLKGDGTREVNDIVNKSNAAAAVRILCDSEKFLSIGQWIETISPDDSGGDSLKFGEKKVSGIKLEECPELNATGQSALPGLGTQRPYGAIYIVNFAKWIVPHNGPFWQPGPFKDDPRNPSYAVLRQRRAQFNFRPLNDIQPAAALVYSTTAA